MTKNGEIQMKTLLKTVLGALFIFISLSSAAQASLIGDTVHVQHANSQRIIDLGTHLVTTNDENISLFSTYQIDIGAESVSFDFNVFGLIGEAATVTISDLDWIGTPGTVTGFTSIDTNLGGWSDSRATFTNDSVIFEFAGLTLNPNLFLNATIQTSHTVVPVPPAAWLFGSGLLGLIGIARRQRANA